MVEGKRGVGERDLGMGMGYPGVEERYLGMGDGNSVVG
jgi:hypothetical protein